MLSLIIVLAMTADGGENPHMPATENVYSNISCRTGSAISPIVDSDAAWQQIWLTNLILAKQMQKSAKNTEEMAAADAAIKRAELCSGLSTEYSPAAPQSEKSQFAS